MKIEINATTRGGNISYPWLGESQNTHIVVLFHDRGGGIVLRGYGTDWQAGDYSST